MVDGPIAAYRELIADETMRPDPYQELAAEKLQSLFNRIRHYDPPIPQVVEPKWHQRLWGRNKAQPLESPPGLYLFGGVGRGKTVMMDLFYRTVVTERKRRAHFHAFMVDVHQRIHKWRQIGREHDVRIGADPIPPLARDLAAQAWLLCFDEFEVVDVADAMIMSRLFSALFDHGVVVLATSNRPPDDLYLDGLQRELFLPFIGLLKTKLDVLQIDAGHDYRLEGMRNMKVYFTPLGAESEHALEQAYLRLAGEAEPVEEELKVQGRVLKVPRSNQGIAQFTFDALCGQPLGAADYLAIASHYHTVMIADLPRMAPEQRNEAKRFATLVDILYEHNVKLLCTADAPPEELYVHGTYAFEFKRTVSRLMEMQRADYLGHEHVD